MGACRTIDPARQPRRQQAPCRGARSDERDHVYFEHGCQWRAIPKDLRARRRPRLRRVLPRDCARLRLVLAVPRSHRTPRRRPGRARQGPGGGGVACVGWATCARIAERAPDAACVPKPIARSEGSQLPGCRHCATEMIVYPTSIKDADDSAYDGEQIRDPLRLRACPRTLQNSFCRKTDDRLRSGYVTFVPVRVVFVRFCLI